MRHSSTVSIVPVLALALAIASLVGCAGMQSGERALLVSGVAYDVAEPGTVFPSAERAAVAALVHTRATATMTESARLRAGSVVRVENGYTWIPARQSASALNSRNEPKVRLSITADHVATYVVHPRVGESRIDRANEHFTRAERRMVDKSDPLHRPMFLLTPSGRIVSYVHGAAEDQVADVRIGRVRAEPAIAAAEPTEDIPSLSLAGGTP